MLSLSKALLLIAVVVGVFWLFRALRAKGGGRQVARRGGSAKALDLRKCRVCGDYVGETDRACGRPNCPAG